MFAEMQLGHGSGSRLSGKQGASGTMTFINDTQNLSWDLQQTFLVSSFYADNKAQYMVSSLHKLQPSQAMLLSHLASGFSNTYHAIQS